MDADDLEWLKIESNPEFIAEIARGRKQIESGQTVSHEQLLRELDQE